MQPFKCARREKRDTYLSGVAARSVGVLFAKPRDARIAHRNGRGKSQLPVFLLDEKWFPSRTGTARGLSENFTELSENSLEWSETSRELSETFRQLSDNSLELSENYRE